MMIGKRKMISIIGPVYNEEATVSEFFIKLTKVLSRLDYDNEVIFVDDGSTDRTQDILLKLANGNKNVKIISFSRNFGHMIALSAGLDHAKGDAVISMDTDLQHPPELIAELVKKWETGAEVVNTVRKDAVGTNVLKKLFSGFFYWLMNRITRVNFQQNSADFRLLDRQVVDTIKTMKEHIRFIRGLISWVGYKQEFVPYKADPRFKGESKYSILRMFSFAVDGITSFSSFPLRLSTYLGLFIASLSFIYIVYAVYLKILKIAIQGWTSVLVAVLFIGGIQLVFLGVIGEYLARVYEETKDRPLYIINRKIGF